MGVLVAGTFIFINLGRVANCSEYVKVIISIILYISIDNTDVNRFRKIAPKLREIVTRVNHYALLFRSIFLRHGQHWTPIAGHFLTPVDITPLTSNVVDLYDAECHMLHGIHCLKIPLAFKNHRLRGFKLPAILFYLELFRHTLSNRRDCSIVLICRNSELNSSLFQQKFHIDPDLFLM